jgi:geranylgeranylglycerol-phosphate geranylgeranyltransferase
MITAGGNAMNDYFDRSIDSIIHKERPIPSKRLSPSMALVFGIGCFIAGFFLSIFINFLCLSIATINIAMLIIYEKYLKKRGFFGNISISYLVASIFLFGGAAVGNIVATAILAILAFLANMGREIMKDVEDIKGDEMERKTFPMKIVKTQRYFCLCFFH